MEDDLSWRFGVVIRRALPNSLIYALCFPKKTYSYALLKNLIHYLMMQDREDNGFETCSPDRRCNRRSGWRSYDNDAMRRKN
jgi:hypothetical protein